MQSGNSPPGHTRAHSPPPTAHNGLLRIIAHVGDAGGEKHAGMGADADHAIDSSVRTTLASSSGSKPVLISTLRHPLMRRVNAAAHSCLNLTGRKLTSLVDAP
jgi:hypothetical protein